MLMRGIRHPRLRIRRGLVESGDPRLGDPSHGQAVSTSFHDVQQGGFENIAGELEAAMKKKIVDTMRECVNKYNKNATTRSLDT